MTDIVCKTYFHQILHFGNTLNTTGRKKINAFNFFTADNVVITSFQN